MKQPKKTIVISGGSDGFGKALAFEFASEYNVIILDRDGEKLAKVAREAGCMYHVCDVSNLESVKETAAFVHNEFGKVDFLINNAGLYASGNIDSVSYEKITEMMNVNVLGTIYMIKAFMGEMKKAKEGMIININSTSGLNSKAGGSTYRSSKWAITGLTKSLQLELAPLGIRVIGFYPGRFESTMMQNGKKTVTKFGLSYEAMTKVIRFVIESPTDLHATDLVLQNTQDWEI